MLFNCAHPEGLRHLQVVIEEIEAVHQIRAVRGGRRMIADISESVLRFEH